MSYDPTQRVPLPQQPGYTRYPPPQNYPPPPPAYTPDYSQPAPATYQQYAAPPTPGAPGAGFDFGKFWNSLQRPGQICLLGGLILFISLFFSWFSVSVDCSGESCAQASSEGIISNYYRADSSSASGFALATGGVTFHSTSSSSSSPGDMAETYSAPWLWLVILGSLALMLLPILVAQGKMAAKQGQTFIVIAAGLALLMEIIYIATVSGALSKSRANASEYTGNSSSTAVIHINTGADFGFWLALLATLAAGGVYVYFTYFKKSSAGYQTPGGYPVAPPTAYPGSQPYVPPSAYPGSQPAAYPPPTAYPGSQPYTPPSAYPGSQPYSPPGQYPGQPPYPGQ